MVWICIQDQVLSNMQQKLDDLCQQLNLAKDQSGNGSKTLDHDDLKSTLKEKFGSERINFVGCGCWLCDQHHHSSHTIQVCVFFAFQMQSLKSLSISIWFSWSSSYWFYCFRIKLQQIRWLMQSQRKDVCLTCQIGVLVSLLLQRFMYVRN